MKEDICKNIKEQLDFPYASLTANRIDERMEISLSFYFKGIKYRYILPYCTECEEKKENIRITCARMINWYYDTLSKLKNNTDIKIKMRKLNKYLKENLNKKYGYKKIELIMDGHAVTFTFKFKNKTTVFKELCEILNAEEKWNNFKLEMESYLEQEEK